MSSVHKLIEMFTVLFISYQGILLLISPCTRNRLYQTLDAITQVGTTDLHSFIQHGRLLIAVAMIPTCLYPRSWFLAKFISLISYVIYICIIYNLYLFTTVENLAQFLFQIFLLFKVLFLIVDDLILLEMEQAKNIAINSQKNILKSQSPQQQSGNVKVSHPPVQAGAGIKDKK